MGGEGGEWKRKNEEEGNGTEFGKERWVKGRKGRGQRGQTPGSSLHLLI